MHSPKNDEIMLSVLASGQSDRKIVLRMDYSPKYLQVGAEYSNAYLIDSGRVKREFMVTLGD